MTYENERSEWESQEEHEERSRRRAWWLLIVLVVLLLFFMCSAFSTGGKRTVKFVARNSECVSCHTEEITAETFLPTQHKPFANEKCTSCHNPHARVVSVKVEQSGGVAGYSVGTLLRWGPLRSWLDTFNRIVFRETSAEQSSKRLKIVGKATLVAKPRALCWTCHGGLRDERAMDFPHSPFATSQCLSCHNPHASRHEALLSQSPKELCLMCHPIGMELGREQAHPPVEHGECLQCHNPHASDHRGILVDNQRDLCFTCHPSVATQSLMSVQHAPFGEADCTSCHEPHGSDYLPLLRDQTPELCYDCHSAIEPRYERASHHPVGTQIDCTDCHRVHASPNRKLLTKAEKDLCLGCHTAVRDSLSMSVVHGPIDSAKPCTQCHVAHGSPYSPLLKNPMPNLCYKCHYSKAEAMSRVSHHPEECTVCHAVHASDHESLLPTEADNSLCYRCHPAVSLQYLTSGHRSVKCLSCHNPHGSRFGALRRHAPTALCSTCHEADTHIRFVGDGDWAHRATPNFYDPTADAPLTCTSTCHNPHGSGRQYMMRKYPWFLDGTCLVCHKSVGIKY